MVSKNASIFSYLEPDKNTKISSLSNFDALQVISSLKEYYLELREKLNIGDVTFGLEIEFEQANRPTIDFLINSLYRENNWEVVDDRSLKDGGEVRTPKMIDAPFMWQDLANVCHLIEQNAVIGDNCGGHVHVCMNVLGNNTKHWLNFIKLWMAYEDIIFRFLNGEFLNARPGVYDQARPISKNLIENFERFHECIGDSNPRHLFAKLDAGNSFIERRKRSVNFTNVTKVSPYQYGMVVDKNTVEFRSPNGTLDPVIWQNNVNLLVHLFMYAKSPNFNEEIINQRISYILEEGIPYDTRKYNRVNRGQAIEFADLIFDNNLDKIYFLSQYLKHEEITSSQSLVRSKRFTKRGI